ncbi:hypothetical protein [Natronoglycomyces albus]|uniref:Uncharacterized protein n=1 Tax=Natronoglycomyces albus TaxID=2811108 RepID=A0A895XUX1_9ACTN|nr:hypothetical protein [Natronoglycomyces albus]QSB05448.1 hypothetical protein JQS30_00425 [Natronoglycomyces albus]
MLLPPVHSAEPPAGVPLPAICAKQLLPAPMPLPIRLALGLIWLAVIVSSVSTVALWLWGVAHYLAYSPFDGVGLPLVTAGGTIAIAVVLLTALLAKQLRHARRWALDVTLALCTVGVAFGVALTMAQPRPAHYLVLALAATLMFLLALPRSRRWFGQRRPPRPRGYAASCAPEALDPYVCRRCSGLMPLRYRLWLTVTADRRAEVAPPDSPREA